MCIAIYKPSNKLISKPTLQNCFNRNKDGCGFAYITPQGELAIKKFMKFDEFYKYYTEAQLESQDSPFLIHFRIKTHGTISEFNCHPFKIDDDHVFIHNGIIGNVGLDAHKSDTQLFNETVLQNLPAGWMESSGIMKLVEDFIGYSKIVVLNKQGDVTIYNEEKGFWDGGVWYSNKSYEEYKVVDVYKPKNKRMDSINYWCRNGESFRWKNNIREKLDPVLKIWRPVNTKDEYVDDIAKMEEEAENALDKLNGTVDGVYSPISKGTVKFTGNLADSKKTRQSLTDPMYWVCGCCGLSCYPESFECVHEIVNNKVVSFEKHFICKYCADDFERQGLEFQTLIGERVDKK